MQTDSPKLLLIFPSTLRGGVEEFNLTAAKGAMRHGWDVHVAFPDTEGTVSLIQDFVKSGVTYHPLAIAEDNSWLPSRTRHFPRFFRTLSLLITLKPRVAQITLPAPNYCLASILACGLLRVPTVVRFGLVLPLKTTVNKWRIRAYSWARTRCQQWVVISQNNRNSLSELFQIPESEITCIYNGSNAGEANVPGTGSTIKLRQQVRDRLNLSDNTRLLITVGRLHFQKGYLDLIPAIPHIVREFPDVRFLWVGDGDLREKLEAQISDYQINHKVLLLGYRSDVQQLLQAADLFVFPTHFEGGQSFAIAEAMANGLPIVTSDASGIPEVIHQNVHGLVFRTGDSCALLESIRWALKHPDNMQIMAENARDRAKDFTEEKMIQSYAEVWKNLSQLSHNSAQNLSALVDTDRA